MPDAPLQLTKEDLDGMTAEQIVTAHKAGQFDTLLTTSDPENSEDTTPGRITARK